MAIILNKATITLWRYNRYIFTKITNIEGNIENYKKTNIFGL